MLALVISLVVHQLPEVQLEVGESTVLKTGKVRMTSGLSICDVRVKDPGVLELIGYTPGRSTLMVWRTDGTQFSLPVKVVPARARPQPVKVTKRAAPRGVLVFEFPESFSELTEVREVDGGLLVVGKSSDGMRLELAVTPSER
jgi:Pilus formation protein N terminal region